jgi:general L-amino acid transport system substrate-binding protein
LLICFFVLASSAAQAGSVLDKIRQTKSLECGVVAELDDETTDDTHGDLSAFGKEICRAVGSAALGPTASLVVREYPSEATAYKALQDGKIDLFVGATPNADLARRYAVTYLHPVFFDWQGLMVHKDSGILSIRDLTNKHVCFIDLTDASTVFENAVNRLGIKVGYFPFEEMGEMEAALVGGHCDAETYDVSKLAAGRAAFHGRKNDFEILPDRLTLDPLAPVIRNGDAQWANIIDWVSAALIQAEVSGVTQANAKAMHTSSDPIVQDLLAVRPAQYWGLALDRNWSRWAIEAVGNYGEIFDRSVGAHSPLRLERGPNKPWTEGGLLWSPPWR